MSPLSNANYNKIVTVIKKIVGEKIHYNKRGVNKQKNEKKMNSNYIGYTSRHLHLRIEEHGLASATGFLKNNSVFDEKTSAQCYALIKVATEEAKDDFYDQLRAVVEQVPGSEDCHGRHER